MTNDARIAKERLAAIKAKLVPGGEPGLNRPVRAPHVWPFPPDEVRWLVKEVERLTKEKEYLAGRVEALSGGEEVFDNDE